MVATPLKNPSVPTPSQYPDQSLTPEIAGTKALVVTEPSPSQADSRSLSLDDFLRLPPEHQEWVDGHLIETNGMTILHVRVQGRVVSAWNAHAIASGLGGEAVPEAPCRTRKQGRRPDVAYLTPELLAEYGTAPSLPQSYPLIAEVASPDDSGEGLLAKAEEYLASGCQEVWILYPEAQLVLAKVAGQDWQVYGPGQTITTQVVLAGCAIAVNALFDPN